MDRWELIVDQLTETGVLSEGRAEVKVRSEILDQSFKTIAYERGTSYETPVALNSRADTHLAQLRDGLRLYDVYFEGSSDIRPTDELWRIPDGWRETNHQYVVGSEVGVTVWELPDGRFAETHHRYTGPVEGQSYVVEDVGNDYEIRPVSIDWEQFNAALPVGTTENFREYIEQRYQRVVESQVRKWIEGELNAGERDLTHDPHSLELADSELVEWVIDWESVPKPDWDATLEDRDREHPGYVINHCFRYVETKGYRDAIHSFPNVVQDALVKSTPGRNLWGFRYELPGDPLTPARAALENETETNSEDEQ